MSGFSHSHAQQLFLCPHYEHFVFVSSSNWCPSQKCHGFANPGHHTLVVGEGGGGVIAIIVSSCLQCNPFLSQGLNKHRKGRTCRRTPLVHVDFLCFKGLQPTCFDSFFPQATRRFSSHAGFPKPARRVKMRRTPQGLNTRPLLLIDFRKSII